MTNKKDNEKNGSASEQPPIAGPLFYKKIAPLRKDVHSDLKISKSPDFRFAAKTNALPIIVSEFFPAQKHFPIFFSSDEEPLPLVAVGPYNENRNMHINGKGEWSKDCYMPLYLRRYPFMFVSTDGGGAENKNQQILAIDEDSSMWTKSEKDGISIFAGEEGKTHVDYALSLCQEFLIVGNKTRDFVKALLEHDLLTWQSITRRNVTEPDAKDETLFSFRSVNPKKLEELNDKTIIEFFRNGYLAAIHAHLTSLQNWQALTREAGLV